MKISQKAEIATILTIGVLVIIAISTFVSSVFLSKNKQTTRSYAAVCDSCSTSDCCGDTCGSGQICRGSRMSGCSCTDKPAETQPTQAPQPTSPPAPAPTSPPAAPPPAPPAGSENWKCPGPNCDKCGVGGWYGAGCSQFLGNPNVPSRSVYECGGVKFQCNTPGQGACGNDGCVNNNPNAPYGLRGGYELTPTAAPAARSTSPSKELCRNLTPEDQVAAGCVTPTKIPEASKCTDYDSISVAKETCVSGYEPVPGVANCWRCKSSTATIPKFEGKEPISIITPPTPQAAIYPTKTTVLSWQRYGIFAEVVRELTMPSVYVCDVSQGGYNVSNCEKPVSLDRNILTPNATVTYKERPGVNQSLCVFQSKIDTSKIPPETVVVPNWCVGL